MTSKANEVAEIRPTLNDDQLSEITDFESALRVLSEAGARVDSVVDYGHGFTLIEDKRMLVGKPMVLVEWTFHQSKKFATADGPLEFVSVYAVLESGQKVIFNDGSTGICAQLIRITEKRVKSGSLTPTQGLGVPAGLTVSEYDYTDEKGVTSAAETFYLSESRAL